MAKTKEERVAWAKSMRELAKTVKAMPKEEREALAAKVGTVTVEGRPLSLFNTCFLWHQAGKALLQVGGFKQWLKAGRVVNKGEHASGYIYIPTQREVRTADGLIEENGKQGFILVPVFDVEKTHEGTIEELALLRSRNTRTGRALQNAEPITQIQAVA
jgi:hypothetical protein